MTDVQVAQLRCPRCGNKCVRFTTNGVEIRVRSPILVGPGGICRAACLTCKELLVLPVVVPSPTEETVRPAST